MPKISETPTFHDGVYQIATTDPVKGGDPAFDDDDPANDATDGQLNAPLKHLADRTRWLKDNTAENSAVSALQSDVDGKITSGSNSDGWWVRFDDGTQITFSSADFLITFTAEMSSSGIWRPGTGLSSTVPYSNEYTSVPVVQATVHAESTSDNQGIWLRNSKSVGVSSIEARPVAVAAETDFPVTIDVIANGRWI